MGIIFFKDSPTGLHQSAGNLVPEVSKLPQTVPNGGISDSTTTVLGTSSGHCQRPVYRPALVWAPYVSVIK